MKKRKPLKIRKNGEDYVISGEFVEENPTIFDLLNALLTENAALREKISYSNNLHKVERVN